VFRMSPRGREGRERIRKTVLRERGGGVIFYLVFLLSQQEGRKDAIPSDWWIGLDNKGKKKKEKEKKEYKKVESSVDMKTEKRGNSKKRGEGREAFASVHSRSWDRGRKSRLGKEVISTIPLIPAQA